MILYYSATGNRRYAAEAVREASGDRCADLLPVLRSGKREPVRSERPLVFVCPVYCWQLPHMVERWIGETPFSGCRDAYFVLTCGGDAGNAASYLKKLCARCGLKYRGTAAIPMPDNYVMMFPSPTEEEIRESLRKAVPLLKEAAERIARGEDLPEKPCGFLGKLCSGPVNRLFYRYYLKDKAFAVSDACVGCGKCASVCPMRNITLEGGKPVWHGSCTHCTACLNLCPASAIEYGKKTRGKRRYRNDRKFPETE